MKRLAFALFMVLTLTGCYSWESVRFTYNRADIAGCRELGFVHGYGDQVKQQTANAGGDTVLQKQPSVSTKQFIAGYVGDMEVTYAKTVVDVDTYPMAYDCKNVSKVKK